MKDYNRIQTQYLNRTFVRISFCSSMPCCGFYPNMLVKNKESRWYCGINTHTHDYNVIFLCNSVTVLLNLLNSGKLKSQYLICSYNNSLLCHTYNLTGILNWILCRGNLYASRPVLLEAKCIWTFIYSLQLIQGPND